MLAVPILCQLEFKSVNAVGFANNEAGRVAAFGGDTAFTIFRKKCKCETNNAHFQRGHQRSTDTAEVSGWRRDCGSKHAHAHSAW